MAVVIDAAWWGSSVAPPRCHRLRRTRAAICRAHCRGFSATPPAQPGPSIGEGGAFFSRAGLPTWFIFNALSASIGVTARTVCVPRHRPRGEECDCLTFGGSSRQMPPDIPPTTASSGPPGLQGQLRSRSPTRRDCPAPASGSREHITSIASGTVYVVSTQPLWSGPLSPAPSNVDLDMSTGSNRGHSAVGPSIPPWRVR